MPFFLSHLLVIEEGEKIKYVTEFYLIDLICIWNICDV